MTAAFWARVGLFWSGGFGLLSSWWAVTAAGPAETVIHAICALFQAALFVLTLRVLLQDLRRRELLALRRCLSLRGLAYVHVWADRMELGNPRRPLAGVAKVGAYRALDELDSARIAMGEAVPEARP